VDPITVIGDFLRELRGKRSLRDIQEVSGVSYTYLRNIEKGVDPRSGNEILPTPDTLRKLSKAYNYPYLELAEMAGIITQEDKLKAIESKKYVEDFTDIIIDQIRGFNDLSFLDQLKEKYIDLLGDSFEFSRESLRNLEHELLSKGAEENVRRLVELVDDVMRLRPKTRRYERGDLYPAITDPLGGTYKNIQLTDDERKEVMKFIEYLIHKREES
jgi:transcriptional regulator with XRE-family HTH domain